MSENVHLFCFLFSRINVREIIMTMYEEGLSIKEALFRLKRMLNVYR